MIFLLAELGVCLILNTWAVTITLQAVDFSLLLFLMPHLGVGSAAASWFFFVTFKISLFREIFIEYLLSQVTLGIFRFKGLLRQHVFERLVFSMILRKISGRSSFIP